MLNYIGNWGGIYGNVELQATDPTWIEHVYVRPDVEQQIASVRGHRAQPRERAPAQARCGSR